MTRKNKRTDNPKRLVLRIAENVIVKSKSILGERGVSKFVQEKLSEMIGKHEK